MTKLTILTHSLLILFAQSLFAESNTYEIPAPKGAEIVPSLKFENSNVKGVVTFLETREIKVSIKEEALDRPVNIQLRNLSVNKMLDYSLQQAGLQWIYSNDRVVIYQDLNDLQGSYKKAAKQKLDDKQSKKSVASAQSNDLPNLTYTIPTFTLERATIKDIAMHLRQASVRADPNGIGINIIALGPISEKRNFKFESGSLTAAMEKACRNYDYRWEPNGSAIVLKPERK